MGHRLSKISTRTGDAGTTGLGDGSRVPKEGMRIQAIGDIDELNSLIGVLLCEEMPANVRGLLSTIQHDLFDIGGELAIPESRLVEPSAVAVLDAAIDRFNEDLPPLKEFILPGGNRSGACCHLARTVCRRAERSVVALAAHAAVSEVTRAYINRLSDFLFVAARILARQGAGQEVLWNRARSSD